MFLLKAGVAEHGVVSEIWYAIGVAQQIYEKRGATLVVTSLTDGVHNCGSLHPAGKAVDLRVLNLEEAERVPVFNDIKKELDPHGFDVCWEGGVGATPATTGAHIHIEFDPKPGESFIHRLEN
jgi:hypothetical protein